MRRNVWYPTGVEFSLKSASQPEQGGISENEIDGLFRKPLSYVIVGTTQKDLKLSGV